MPPDTIADAARAIGGTNWTAMGLVALVVVCMFVVFGLFVRASVATTTKGFADVTLAVRDLAPMIAALTKAQNDSGTMQQVGFATLTAQQESLCDKLTDMATRNHR